MPTPRRGAAGGAWNTRSGCPPASGTSHARFWGEPYARLFVGTCEAAVARCHYRPEAGDPSAGYTDFRVLAVGESSNILSEARGWIDEARRRLKEHLNGDATDGGA
jgi:hypothetical protein